MKTLLVIAQHPALPEAMRAALGPDNYRLIHRMDLEEAEPLLQPGFVQGCVFDAESGSVQALWAIEKLRRRLPDCPLLVYAGATPWEWEEEAYLQGVSHVLAKPVRARLLHAVLERLTSPPRANPPAQPRPLPVEERVAEPAPQGDSHPQMFQALEVLRDFSAILTHSLQAEALLKQFLLLLREIMGVNRAAIFLRQPPSSFGGMAPATETPRLRSACALGLAPGLLEHFQLSLASGIGGHIFQQGRILRRQSREAQDAEMQKEFELLGAQVAIPVLDRETLVGVAVFDGRVTGEPLTSAELALVFHLLEGLGLAIKNIWLHDQLASNHEMLADVLRQLSSACVVVNRDLNIVHANKAARQFFSRPGHRGTELEFSELPQVLGSRIYQVLKTGTGIAPFRYQPAEAPDRAYQVTIVPFQKEDSALPNSVLLVAEDRTQSEQLQRLEIETANLRLVRAMADRLAHEIGNALVPLSTHQQLLADKYREPEFRSSLEAALADGIRRISRLISQMRFLSRDEAGAKEAFPLAPLVDEAFQEAQRHFPASSTQLKCENGQQPVILSGDRAALKHALAEILMNAIQANPADARVEVRLQSAPDGNGGNRVDIEIQDNGTGFSAASVQKAAEPFYTTRNVGLGLGLTVTRKIIENHHGKLTFVEPKLGQHGLVRISLPSTGGE